MVHPISITTLGFSLLFLLKQYQSLSERNKIGSQVKSCFHAATQKFLCPLPVFLTLPSIRYMIVIPSTPQLTMFSLFLSFRDFTRPFWTVLTGNLQYPDWKTYAIFQSPPVVYQLSGCTPQAVFGSHGWSSLGTLTFSVSLLFWAKQFFSAEILFMAFSNRFV